MDILAEIQKAKNDLIAMEVGGIDPAEYEEMTGHKWVNPYEKIIESLKGYIKMCEELKSHNHDEYWDDNGFCTMCGMDGNA